MDYEKQTIAQLKELCAQRGLSTPTKAKKADYIEILKSAATHVAASDDVPSAAALDEPVVTSDISEPNPSPSHHRSQVAAAAATAASSCPPNRAVLGHGELRPHQPHV
jgi:hypothetical protein